MSGLMSGLSSGTVAKSYSPVKERMKYNKFSSHCKVKGYWISKFS